MNGSDVWGSSTPYGDVLPVFKWNIYKRMSIFHSKLTVIINDSLQNTPGEKKAKCHLETFDFITCLYSYYS